MNNNVTQLHNLSPEGLSVLFSNILKSQLTEVKKHLQPKEPTVYLTRLEVGELLKINVSSVHNWTKKKILQSYQVGGRVYYKRAEVEYAMVKLNK